MRRSIYKSNEYKKIFYSLYDEFTSLIPFPVQDGFLSTSFGETHYLAFGAEELPVLFHFHGGNTINPHALLPLADLARNFRIISPDIIGHPGKSAEIRINTSTLDYGKWASEVIEGFKFEKVNCIGGSFGGGVLMHLASFNPGIIKKAVLVIPTGFVKSSTIDNLKIFGFSLLRYNFFKTEENLLQLLKPLILDVSLFTDLEIKLFKAIFNGLRLATGMPRPVRKDELQDFSAPTMVAAAEKDIMCPANKVFIAASEVIKNFEKKLLFKNRPHMVTAYKDDMKVLVENVKEFLAD